MNWATSSFIRYAGQDYTGLSSSKGKHWKLFQQKL